MLPLWGIRCSPVRTAAPTLEGGSEKQIIDSLGKIGALLPADTLCLIGHNDTTTIERELESNLFMRRGLRHYR